MNQQPQKITASQLEELYLFTRKHFVEHYDLQTELVDHLSMAIEKQWETQSHLSFEKALQIEFKKFGVFGFMEVVEERQKALGKKYGKLIWKHFIEFFKLPKILLTVLLTYGLYEALANSWITELYLFVALMIFFISFIVDAILRHRTYKKWQKQGRKKWMFEDMLLNIGAGTSFGIIPIHFINFTHIGSDSLATVNPLVLMIYSFLIVSMILLAYIMRFDIPKKAHKYLLETYPEYQLVQSS